MNLLNNTLHGKNLLLFNNQAGGGHKTVCEAVVAQVSENKGKIIVKDAFYDILGQKISKHLYAFWNDAMKSENLNKLNLPLKFQPLGEFFEGSIAIAKVADWLFKHDIDAIINPQPTMLHNITKAVRLVNNVNKYVRKNKKTILVYNILTELPTPHTTDFFKTYKRLWRQDRAVCKLVTIAPAFVEVQGKLVEPTTNNLQAYFWKKHTGFQLSDVIYDELPLRKPFLEAAKMDPQTIKTLKFEIKTEAALQLLKDNQIVAQDTTVGVFTKQADRADTHFLMLGSQAGVESTLHYVSNFIQINKMSKKETKQVVYVFCGDHSPLQKNKSLFEQVCNKIRKSKSKQELPDNLEILPLEGQKADYVALILRKSKTTITRAGGVTGMELYITASKDCQMFIHSNQDDILKGMPPWEAGNVMYLQKSKNAKVITRKTGLDLFLNL